MLFKTIYGPELFSTFFWIKESGPIRQSDLIEAFGASLNKGKSSITNIRDSLTFLESLSFIKRDKGVCEAIQPDVNEENFKLKIIETLRSIQLNESRNKTDKEDIYFLKIIDDLYVQSDNVFQNELYLKVNSLDYNTTFSEEKINAWKRVIEYLGIGRRAYGGLKIQYSESLVLDVFEKWNTGEGPLQDFLEQHFNRYLPWKNNKGDISVVLLYTLEDLERQGKIVLLSKQDLPSRSYCYGRKIKWIKQGDINECTMC